MIKLDDLNLDALNQAEIELVKSAFKSNGELYSSKPKKASGDTKFIWRWLGFLTERYGPLSCMPVCADFDIYDAMPDATYEERKAHEKYLHTILDRIKITPQKMQGVLRWGRALGF